MRLTFHRRFIDNAMNIDSCYYNSIQKTLEDIEKLDFRKSGSRLKKLKNQKHVWSARFSDSGRILWSFYPSVNGDLSIVVWDIGLDHDKIYSRVQLPIDPEEVRAVRITDLLNPKEDDEKTASVTEGKIPLFASLDLKDYLDAGFSEDLFWEVLCYSRDELNRFADKHEKECYTLMELEAQKLHQLGERLYVAAENRMNPDFWKRFYPRLSLHQTQEIYVDPNTTRGPLLLTGPAGTGKTTIAFHRFLYHALNTVKFKIMYITWSKDLADRIRQEFLKIIGKDTLQPNWEITDIHTFLDSRLRLKRSNVRISDRPALFKRLQQAANDLGLPVQNQYYELRVSQEKAVYEIITRIKGTAVRPKNWLSRSIKEEWEEILRSRKNYLYTIDEDQVQTIFNVYWHYITNLYDDFPNHLDYYDALYLDIKNSSLAEFDAIMVDEVQDLTEIELIYISKLIKDQRYLLLCGDQCQKRLMTNFQERGIEYYLRIFFDDRNKKLLSKKLDQNYRNTAQIFKISDLYFNYIKAEHNISLESDIQCRPSTRIGKKPLILALENEKLDVRFSKARLIATALASEGLTTAVLIPDPGDLKDKIEKEFRSNCNKLEKAFCKFEAENIGKKSLTTPKIYNLKDVAGLEFDAVIMLNCIQPSTLPMMDEAKRDYFRKIYVGLTRPRDEIIIIGAPQLAVNVFFNNENCTQDTSRYKEALLEKIFTDRSDISNVSSIEAIQNEMSDEQRKELLKDILNDMRLNIESIKYALRSYVNLPNVSIQDKYSILIRVVSPRFEYKTEIRREAWNLMFAKFPKGASKKARKLLTESYRSISRELIPSICDRLIHESPSDVDIVWQAVEKEFKNVQMDEFHLEMIRVLDKHNSVDFFQFLDSHKPEFPVSRPGVSHALMELIFSRNLHNYLVAAVSRFLYSGVPSSILGILKMRIVRKNSVFHSECIRQLLGFGKKRTNKEILKYVFDNVSDETCNDCFILWSRIRYLLNEDDNERTLSSLRDSFLKNAQSLSRWVSKFHYYEFLIESINDLWGVFKYLMNGLDAVLRQEEHDECDYPDARFLKRVLLEFLPRIERPEHRERLSTIILKLMFTVGPILSVDEYIDLGDIYFNYTNATEFVDYLSHYTPTHFRNSKCFSVDWIGRAEANRPFISQIFKFFHKDREAWNQLTFKEELNSENAAQAVRRRFEILIKMPLLLRTLYSILAKKQSDVNCMENSDSVNENDIFEEDLINDLAAN